MAILIGNTITLAPSSAAATSYTVPLSTLGLDLQEDDYVVIGMVSNNTSATLSETSGLGTTWDTSGKLNLASGARGWLTWAKVTAGPTISNPTFTHSASGTGIWQVWVQVWRDCDTTGGTPFKDSLVATDHGTVTTGSITTTAMTPIVDDCTILYFVFESNGSAPGPMRFLSDKVVGEAKQATDTNAYTSYVVGTVQQQTKAATAQTCYAMQSQRFGSIVLAIRNKTGGAMCRDSRAGITKVAWFGDFGTKVDGAITWGKLVDMVAWTGGQIAGITVDATSAAPTESSIAGFSPAWGTYSVLGNTRNVASEWVGGYYSLPSAVNMTGKLFSIEWLFQNLGVPVGTEGAIVAFADASGNAKVFRLAPKLVMDPGVRYTSMIDLANGTSIHTEGTGAPWSAVTKFGIGYHRAGSNATNRTIAFRNALLHAATTMTGGSASQPLDITYLDKALNGWGYGGLCDKLGDTVVAKTPVQFGDGTVKTYIDATATSAGYPAAYDVTLQPLWNVPASAAGITLKASASDTFNMVACSFVTESVQPLTIDAAYSTSAATSFAGATVVGPWDVTWKDGVPCASATFSGCGEIAGKGADWTNVIISDTASTDAALAEDTSGAVLTGLTIDGTGAAYALELGASNTAITLTDCTLTAGSTDKVHVKATTGTVTITISGTTALAAGDVTTDGATVVIAAPELYQEVVITGLAATYRVQIFDIEYVLTVSGITVTPIAGATYTHAGITWTVRSASITAGAGTITVYGTGTPAASGTLTKTGGTGDASVAFSAYVVDGTELYIGVPGATSYTWTDSVAAAAPRVIRVRVMEDGPGTSDAIEMIDAIVGMCGITEGTESVGYLVAAVADDVYNDRGVDGSTITGITIDDTTLRLEIASGTIINYGGTNVLVVDGRDLYAYETYWLGTTAGMRDEARFIEAIDAVNFRCSNFKLKGTSGYPIMINNCFIVDAATGIFSSIVDYSGDPISNHPEHMKAIVVTTSDSVVTGTLSEFVAAVPTAAAVAAAVGVEAAANPFAANVKKVNDTTIIGTGVPPTYANMPVPTDPGDPFRVA